VSLSAMKQALDDICGAKLCEINSISSRAEMIRLMDKAITALRQAIEEAEKHEPWVKTYCGGKPNYTTPAEKQEPVAWREVAGKTTQYYDYNEDGRGEPLYAAPQPDLARVGEVGVWGDKREWVGLTDDEIWDCYTSQGKQFYLAIEAKLKEKNTLV